MAKYTVDDFDIKQMKKSQLVDYNINLSNHDVDKHTQINESIVLMKDIKKNLKKDVVKNINIMMFYFVLLLFLIMLFILTFAYFISNKYSIKIKIFSVFPNLLILCFLIILVIVFLMIGSDFLIKSYNFN